MEQKKKRGAKPKPLAEKKKGIQIYIKLKHHKPFLKEISEILKKYQAL
jgi:hypothetical protein